MVQAASRCVKDREDGRWYGCVRGGWALEGVSHLDDALVMLGRAVGKLSIGRAVMWNYRTTIATTMDRGFSVECCG